jgi:hypothetical protein
VDDQSVADYGEKLEANLQSLLERVKSGTYRAPLVKRVHIPKNDVTDHFKTSQCGSLQNQPPWRWVFVRVWGADDKLAAQRGRICPGVKSERSEAVAPPRRGLVARITPGGLSGPAWCRG